MYEGLIGLTIICIYGYGTYNSCRANREEQIARKIEEEYEPRVSDLEQRFIDLEDKFSNLEKKSDSSNKNIGGK